MFVWDEFVAARGRNCYETLTLEGERWADFTFVLCSLYSLIIQADLEASLCQEVYPEIVKRTRTSYGRLVSPVIVSAGTLCCCKVWVLMVMVMALVFSILFLIVAFRMKSCDLAASRPLDRPDLCFHHRSLNPANHYLFGCPFGLVSAQRFGFGVASSHLVQSPVPQSFQGYAPLGLISAA